jgi:hypothetical protein
MKPEHYLPNIQIPGCAQDKDPLCVPRSAGRVEDLPAVLVHELAILDHNLIVLSLFLQAQENIQYGSLVLLSSLRTCILLQQSKRLASTYRTKILDALALKLRPRAPFFQIDLFAFSNVKPEEPNMVITHEIISSASSDDLTKDSENTTSMDSSVARLTSRRMAPCFRTAASSRSSSEDCGRTGGAGRSVRQKISELTSAHCLAKTANRLKTSQCSN